MIEALSISDTASPIEVVFAIGGLVALAVNLYALRDAVCDLQILRRESRNGLLRMAAKANRGRERSRVVLQSLLLLAAFQAMVSPDPAEPYASSAGRQAVVVALLAFQYGTAIAALLERRTRKRMLRYDERRNRRHGD